MIAVVKLIGILAVIMNTSNLNAIMFLLLSFIYWEHVVLLYSKSKLQLEKIAWHMRCYLFDWWNVGINFFWNMYLTILGIAKANFCITFRKNTSSINRKHNYDLSTTAALTNVKFRARVQHRNCIAFPQKEHYGQLILGGGQHCERWTSITARGAVNYTKRILSLLLADFFLL